LFGFLLSFALFSFPAPPPPPPPPPPPRPRRRSRRIYGVKIVLTNQTDTPNPEALVSLTEGSLTRVAR
jgi:hypothetical protein